MARCASCGTTLSEDRACPHCGTATDPMIVLDPGEPEPPGRHTPERRWWTTRRLVVAALLVVVGLAAGAVWWILRPAPDTGGDEPTGATIAMAAGDAVELVHDEQPRRSEVLGWAQAADLLVTEDRLVILHAGIGAREVSSIPLSEPQARTDLGRAEHIAVSATAGRVWLVSEDAREVDAGDGALLRTLALPSQGRFLADLGGPVLVGDPGHGSESRLDVWDGARRRTIASSARWIAARPGLVAWIGCEQECRLHLTPTDDGSEQVVTGGGLDRWIEGTGVFSADGRMMAALRGAGAGVAITITDISAGSSSSYLLGSVFTTLPTWSRDGSLLVIGVGEGSFALRILAFERDGGFQPRTLSVDPRAPFRAIAVR